MPPKSKKTDKYSLINLMSILSPDSKDEYPDSTSFKKYLKKVKKPVELTTILFALIPKAIQENNSKNLNLPVLLQKMQSTYQLDENIRQKALKLCSQIEINNDTKKSITENLEKAPVLSFNNENISTPETFKIFLNTPPPVELTKILNDLIPKLIYEEHQNSQDIFSVLLEKMKETNELDEATRRAALDLCKSIEIKNETRTNIFGTLNQLYIAEREQVAPTGATVTVDPNPWIEMESAGISVPIPDDLISDTLSTQKDTLSTQKPILKPKHLNPDSFHHARTTQQPSPPPGARSSVVSPKTKSLISGTTPTSTASIRTTATDSTNSLFETMSHRSNLSPVPPRLRFGTQTPLLDITTQTATKTILTGSLKSKPTQLAPLNNPGHVSFTQDPQDPLRHPSPTRRHGTLTPLNYSPVKPK